MLNCIWAFADRLLRTCFTDATGVPASRTCRPIGAGLALDDASSAVGSMQYAHVLHDARYLLAADIGWPPCTAPPLTRPGPVSGAVPALLRLLAMVEGAHPWKLQRQQHVLYETQQWALALQCEIFLARDATLPMAAALGRSVCTDHATLPCRSALCRAACLSAVPQCTDMSSGRRTSSCARRRCWLMLCCSVPPSPSVRASRSAAWPLRLTGSPCPCACPRTACLPVPSRGTAAHSHRCSADASCTSARAGAAGRAGPGPRGRGRRDAGGNGAAAAGACAAGAEQRAHVGSQRALLPQRRGELRLAQLHTHGRCQPAPASLTRRPHSRAGLTHAPQLHDLDVAMMQVAACVLPAEHFVFVLVDRFNLTPWLQPAFAVC